MNIAARLIIPMVAIGIAFLQMNAPSSPASVSKTAKVILVMGGPGSGKGTQSLMLAREFGFVHVSSGDLLREKSKRGGELANLILEKMSNGLLVSHEVTSKVLDEEFEQKGRDQVFLLDGFPRSLQNYMAYAEHTNNTLEIIGVVYLNCSNEVMEQRILQRAKKVNRPDNDPEAIRNRIWFFNEVTNELLDKLRPDTRIISVQADTSMEQVYAELRESILKLGFTPLLPTPKL